MIEHICDTKSKALHASPPTLSPKAPVPGTLHEGMAFNPGRGAVIQPKCKSKTCKPAGNPGMHWLKSQALEADSNEPSSRQLGAQRNTPSPPFLKNPEPRSIATSQPATSSGYHGSRASHRNFGNSTLAGRPPASISTYFVRICLT